MGAGMGGCSISTLHFDCARIQDSIIYDFTSILIDRFQPDHVVERKRPVQEVG